MLYRTIEKPIRDFLSGARENQPCVATPDYGISGALVISNARIVENKGKITHLPIYYTPFLT